MFKKFHISHKFFAILTNIATKEQKNKNFGCANELYRNKIGCDIVSALCAPTISQPILLRYIDNMATLHVAPGSVGDSRRRVFSLLNTGVEMRAEIFPLLT